MQQIAWHNLAWEEAVRLLFSDSEKGLSENRAKELEKKFGPNKLPEEKPLSGVKIFIDQLKSPLVLILLIAGFISVFLLKDFTDAIIIFAVIFVNTFIGFIQEHKASRTLRELKRVVRHEAEILRGGTLRIIDSQDLVVGDIIVLNAGNKVPADARVIKSYDLKVNEMALTGEWISAEKNPGVLPEKTPLADRDNMIYMGTVVEGGKGWAIVTGTGVETEIGKVAALIKETEEEKTPYQKKLIYFSKVVGVVITLISLAIFFLGVMGGKDFTEMFTTAVAVAVAAIPEGLPVAITVILALGMQRILVKKGLVRKLISAETLGGTSIICTDKTATLTEGKMRVSEFIGDKNSILRAVVLTSSAFIENPDAPQEEWILRGEATDRAFLQAGIEAGINHKKEFERNKVAEIPFDSINKFTAVAYQEENSGVLYVSGAPEKILELSKLSDDSKDKWEKEIRGLAQKGLRVVASARKQLRKDEVMSVGTVKDLEILGLIALKDPIRKEVKEAIGVCLRAGLRPIMVTGDHKLTAKAVAEELGLEISEENILEGKDLDEISDDEFEKVLPKIQIYARVEPKHKLRIVEGWQKMGHVVAMTGDGINDAPALKKADIGVALGSGTDVAKETSDLVLLNDSFSVIVSAIEEGRVIIDNIRKVITYLMSDSFTETILIGVSILLGWPLPILAAQILWINLIEDGPLGLALAFEPKAKDVMRLKPANKKIPLFTKEMKVLIFIIGFITDLLLLGLFFWLIKFSEYEISHIRSIIFAGLAIDSIFYIFSCKNLRKNLWQINIFSNRFLVFVWLGGIFFLLAALYLAPLQTLLKVEPLNFFDWQLVLGLGFINLFLIEATKWYFIRKQKP